jgi:molybdopterin molybdotransferase
MDGYAFALADLAGEPPWTLPVAGEIRAGAEAAGIVAGAASRIFTGAAVPPGADTVVAQENVARDEHTIRLARRPERGLHIRRAGEDIELGSVALVAGARLGAGALALAAMLDRAELVVARRPRVTILCTGNELRAPGTAGGPASIPESNSAPIAALARQAAAHVTVVPIARDDLRAVERAIDAALEASDLLVTIGGVSVGDHDVVRPALHKIGVAVAFERVAIKPGKPLVLGRRSMAHVLGLPGNPASALVTFALFGIPLLRALQGDAAPFAMPFGARLSVSRKRGPDRLEFVRARLRWGDGAFAAIADDNQASGAATSLASSDGIAFVPAGTEPLAAGTMVDFLRWTDA